MPGFLTVQNPAPPVALADLADMKADLGITDASFDAYLTRKIAQATGIICDYTNRATFGQESLVEVFRIGGTVAPGPFVPTVAPYGTPLDAQRHPLILSRAPVLQVASVADPGGSLDPSLWECETGSGLLFRLFNGVRVRWSILPVTVTYTAGFLTVPGNVQEAAMALVSAAYYSRNRDPSITLESGPEIGQIRYKDAAASNMEVDDVLAGRLAPYISTAW